MKFDGNVLVVNHVRRSREGAWIEIIAKIVRAAYYMVAPVRERGLKLAKRVKSSLLLNLSLP